MDFIHFISTSPVPRQFFQCDHPSRTSVLHLPVMLGDFIVSCRSLILITIMVESNRPIPQLQSSHPTRRGFYKLENIRYKSSYDLRRIPGHATQAYTRLDLSSTSGFRHIGLNRWPVDSPHKRPITRKMFPFDNVIMIMVDPHDSLYRLHLLIPLLHILHDVICIHMLLYNYMQAVCVTQPQKCGTADKTLWQPTQQWPHRLGCQPRKANILIE